MTNFVKKYLVKLLRDTADKIDAGNSEINEEQALEIMSVIGHHTMSKEEACLFLNISRSRFDELIRQGKLPKGRKRKGLKELLWYEDELLQKL